MTHSELISDISHGKQHSAPLPEASVLSSGRIIPGVGRDLPDRPKARTSTHSNSSWKPDRAGMTGGEDPECPADIGQPLRKQGRMNETPPTGPNTDSHAGSEPPAMQQPLGDLSSLATPSPEASDHPAMSAEALMIELREDTERLKTPPSGDQATTPAQFSSTSPPLFSPKT